MSIAQSKPYTIFQLLSEEIDYQIPVYQRNYAWGRPQIRALIQDVYDYYTLDKWVDRVFDLK